MTAPITSLFAFSEADHLTRIHLRLALEDAGFSVEEAADELRLVGPLGKGGSGNPPSDAQ